LSNWNIAFTYHYPGSRVVSLESESQPSVRRQHGGVSAGGVVVVQGVDVALPPGLLAGSEDVEVVAVEVWDTLVVLIDVKFHCDGHLRMG
jgi:hypothetical protein